MKLYHLKLIQAVNVLLFVAAAYLYSTQKEVLLSPGLASTALGSWLLGGFLVLLLVVIVIVSVFLYLMSRQNK
jgi:hypothetical protein